MNRQMNPQPGGTSVGRPGGFTSGRRRGGKVTIGRSGVRTIDRSAARMVGSPPIWSAHRGNRSRCAMSVGDSARPAASRRLSALTKGISRAPAAAAHDAS